MVLKWFYGAHTCESDSMVGNWNIELNKTHVLFLEDILDYLTKDNLKKIKLKHIAWKYKHRYHKDKTSIRIIKELAIGPKDRYEEADINCPGIITNGPNPFDNKYRMLDGRRRLCKRLLNDEKEGLFYVLPWEEIKPLFVSDPKIIDERMNLSEEEMNNLKEK